MATKKQAVNENLAKAFEAVKPANPALSSADKTYLRGLRRRGFTQQEIQNVAQKAGFQVPADLFETRKKAAPVLAKPTPAQR
jgi:SOS response regulatory protein OraA/RecX